MKTRWIFLFWGIWQVAYSQLWQIHDFDFTDSLKKDTFHVRDTFNMPSGIVYFSSPSHSKALIAKGIQWQKTWKKSRLIFEPYLVFQSAYSRPFYLHENVVPGGGIVLDKKNIFLLRPVFTWETKWNKYVRGGFSYGHEHFGTGYRSFLPSRHAPLYPSGFLNFLLRRFQYSYRLAYWNQKDSSIYYNKFTAMQFIRWDALKWLTLTFFESATWVPSKNTHMHAIELAYMQPFAFLRPIDYSLGSPANMFMSGGIETRCGEYSCYAQLVLDEFYISEYKNELRHLLHPKDTTILTGAWVNKQALQAGLKTYSFFGIDRLGFLFETNIARPYIYSHVFPEMSYSHQNQPVAHPLGANFFENIIWMGYSWRKNDLVLGGLWAEIGMDEDSIHMGQNILLSTFNGYRGNNIPVPTYGNKIAQGNKITLWTMYITWTRSLIFYNIPIKFFLSFGFRKNTFIDQKIHPLFSLGFLQNIKQPDLLNF